MGQWSAGMGSSTPQLKLQPDAVFYQAPPTSMHSCRYWTQDPGFGLDPSDVVNEMAAAVRGAEPHPSGGAPASIVFLMGCLPCLCRMVCVLSFAMF